MINGIHPKRLHSKTEEFPHACCMDPFMFSQEIDVTTFELDIPKALILASLSIVYTWYFFSDYPITVGLWSASFGAAAL